MDFAAFCKQFGDFVPPAVKTGDRYYVVNEEVAAFKSGEQRKPHATGLFLGMDGREFAPTTALLSLLAQHSTKKATLKGERTEWLFLCGRDIFTEGFTTKEAKGYVLVQNERDENLGYGEITSTANGERLLKNKLDLGNYLRHETPGEKKKQEHRKKKTYGRTY